MDDSELEQVRAHRPRLTRPPLMVCLRSEKLVSSSSSRRVAAAAAPAGRRPTGRTRSSRSSTSRPVPFFPSPELSSKLPFVAFPPSM